METELSDGLLGRVKFALLLVVIEDARRRIQVFGIGVQRFAGLIEKLAKTLRFAQQIEIALHQFRVPEWLEALLINRQTFSHRTLPVSDQGLCLYRESLVAWKLFVVTANELSRICILFLCDQA